MDAQHASGVRDWTVGTANEAKVGTLADGVDALATSFDVTDGTLVPAAGGGADFFATIYVLRSRTQPA